MKVRSFFIVLLFMHFLEHVVQMSELYILHWSRSNCLGLVGLVFPELVHNEILHWTQAVLTFFGFLYLYRLPVTTTLSLLHLLEHQILLTQYIMDYPRCSIGQIFFPRIELHFTYNLVIMVSFLIEDNKKLPTRNKIGSF